MSTFNGWNITKLTGHADPILGGFAIDRPRRYLWVTEQRYGVFQLNMVTNDYEFHRFPLEGEALYGSIAVASDGSVFVGVLNDHGILRFDRNLQPLPGISSRPVLGLHASRGAVAALVDLGDGQAVAGYSEAGDNVWTTDIAHGPSANFFYGFSPVFCTSIGIVALVGQRIIECVILGRDGAIVERRPLCIPCGSWNESLVAQTPYERRTPTGRRYLLDATYDARSNSLLLLYAPPSGNHGLVVIRWPLNVDEAVEIYDIPLWTTKIMSVANILVCYGSEQFSGPKMLFTATLDELARIPIEEMPVLYDALNPTSTPLIEDLFRQRAVGCE
jgi:hypothetical protein